MILIIGSTNDEFLDMGKLTFDKDLPILPSDVFLRRTCQKVDKLSTWQ